MYNGFIFMRKLDIGSGRKNFEDYETLDSDPSVGARHCVDIENIENLDPYRGQFDEIRAHHILEHIRNENKVKVMATLWAMLKQGGTLDIEIPLAGSEQFYQDPTHLSWWTDRTFWYFTKGNNFGEAFEKRYSQYPVPLFEKVSDKKDGWKYSIIFRKV